MLIHLFMTIASVQLLAAARVHPEPTDVRIIGGKEAVPHSAPYLVYIEINPDTAASRRARVVEFCSGTLLTKRHVLTAGHCVADGRKVMYVLAGAHKIMEKESTQQKVKFSKILLHKDYNQPPFANDIALISLKTPVKTDKYVDVVKLPKVNDAKKSYVGSEATVFGWGMINYEPKKVIPRALMTTSVKVISNVDCRTFANKTEVYDGDICTSTTSGKGTCHGDSGGPLLLNGVQIGIISRGINSRCVEKNPNVYVNVGNYLKWIEAAVKQLGS